MIVFRTFGTIDLRNGQGRDVRTVLAQPKRLALLAMLAVSPHVRRDRDLLQGYLWPNYGPDRAQAALRQALKLLRHELGNDVISVAGNRGVSIDTRLMACDACEFERACDEGRPEDALDLYVGDLLPGLVVGDASPEFDNWLEAERVRLHQRALESAMGLVTWNRGRGQTPLAVQWSRRAMDIAPEDERILRTFLELLADAGDCDGALRAYEDFAAALNRDLGIPPSSLTQRLVATIRASAGIQRPLRKSGGEPPDRLSHRPNGAPHDHGKSTCMARRASCTFGEVDSV